MKSDQKRISSFTTGELAQYTQGILVGNQDVVISGVAEAAKVKAGEVTYAVNEKYVNQLLISNAGCAIVPLAIDDSVEFPFPVIKCQNPYFAFSIILSLFERKPSVPDQAIAPTAVIHATAELSDTVIVEACAVIDEDSSIGKGSRIGANSYIGRNVSIGENTYIAPNVTIRDDSVIGNNVTIHAGTVIGTDGYGFVFANGRYEKIPQIGIVEIHDNVEIGSNVCIDRATIGKTVIGRGTKIDNLVQIGHNVVLGENCALVSQVGISGSTIVGDNCRFAGRAATSGHLTIGNNTTIGAKGVATKDIACDSYVSGFPAKPHKEEQKIIASLPRLPELIRKMKKLEKEIEKLKEEA